MEWEAPRAISQAAEKSLFCVSCPGSDVLEPCSVSPLKAVENLDTDVQISMSLRLIAQLERAKW